MPVKTTYPILFLTACLILFASLPFQGCGNHTKPAAVTRNETPAKPSGIPDSFRRAELTPAATNKILQLFKKNSSIGDDGNLSVDEMFALHGHLFMLISKGTGTCKFTYLAVWEETKFIKCVELEANCDTDFSLASYTYKEFSRREDSLFDIRIITEKVKDTSLVDGMEIKGHRSREDVKTVTDTLSDSFSASTLLSAQTPAWPAIWKVSE